MTTDTRTNLHEELASLFFAARNETARRLREFGVPLAVSEAQVTIERDPADPNAWRSTQILVDQNILASSRASLVPLAPLLSPDVVSAVLESASHIAESFRDNLPFFSPFEGSGWILTTAAADHDAPSESFDNDATDIFCVKSTMSPLDYALIKIVARRKSSAHAPSRRQRPGQDR